MTRELDVALQRAGGLLARMVIDGDERRPFLIALLRVGGSIGSDPARLADPRWTLPWLARRLDRVTEVLMSRTPPRPWSIAFAGGRPLRTALVAHLTFDVPLTLVGTESTPDRTHDHAMADAVFARTLAESEEAVGRSLTRRLDEGRTSWWATAATLRRSAGEGPGRMRRLTAELEEVAAERVREARDRRRLPRGIFRIQLPAAEPEDGASVGP